MAATVPTRAPWVAPSVRTMRLADTLSADVNAAIVVRSMAAALGADRLKDMAASHIRSASRYRERLVPTHPRYFAHGQAVAEASEEAAASLRDLALLAVTDDLSDRARFNLRSRERKEGE
jgi:hypothetical protein